MKRNARLNSAEYAGEKATRRSKLIHAAHVKYGYTLKEIADHLEIHYTTVSKIIKGFDEK
jgi:DNA-binding MarR family transcriptional regulator